MCSAMGQLCILSKDGYHRMLEVCCGMGCPILNIGIFVFCSMTVAQCNKNPSPLKVCITAALFPTRCMSRMPNSPSGEQRGKIQHLQWGYVIAFMTQLKLKSLISVGFISYKEQ